MTWTPSKERRCAQGDCGDLHCGVQKRLHLWLAGHDRQNSSPFRAFRFAVLSVFLYSVYVRADPLACESLRHLSVSLAGQTLWRVDDL